MAEDLISSNEKEALDAFPFFRFNLTYRLEFMLWHL
jgi:hypothetical protein